MKVKIKKLLPLLAMSTILVIGEAFAFWHQQVNENNKLQADTVKADIKEIFKSNSSPNGSVQKKVDFHNSGTSDVFVRFSYAESWERKEGGKKFILSNKVDNGYVVEKGWISSFGDDWLDGGDGWFYFKKILKPNESTSVLNNVTFPSYTGKLKKYEDADYNLYFKVEMLQASTGESTLNREAINREASQKVFNKTATVTKHGTVQWE